MRGTAFLLLATIALIACQKIDREEPVKPLEEVDDVCTKMVDASFMKYCYDNYDLNKDSKVSMSEAAAIKEMIIPVSVKLNSIKGIEYFTNLTALRFQYSKTAEEESLDLKYNLSLRSLIIENGNLKTLLVSKNLALEELVCMHNKLTSLDVSKNIALKSLACYNNPLTSLDVSNNETLEYLSIGLDQIQSIDLSKNKNLISLDCYNGILSSLDLSKNPALKRLFCDDNRLTTLDLSKNTKLEELSCNRNQLSSLLLANSKSIISIECYGNLLKSLDLTCLSSQLKWLFCANNYITYLDISEFNALLKVSSNTLQNILYLLGYVEQNTLLEMKVNLDQFNAIRQYYSDARLLDDFNIKIYCD